MVSFFDAAKIYTSRVQNALGTQFLIFAAFDGDPNKRGVFIVDLGSLPTTTDQQALANAIKQSMKKLVFSNDNDPVRDELELDGFGSHILFDVNGNNNILSIAWAHKVSPRNYFVTLTALRSGAITNPTPNTIQFEKCPTASRAINNIDNLDDLRILLIGNDPKLVHIGVNNSTNISSIEMAGH